MNSSSQRNRMSPEPVSESISVSAPRCILPTPVVTQTSIMVLRSHSREGRSSAEKPKPEIARLQVVRK